MTRTRIFAIGVALAATLAVAEAGTGLTHAVARQDYDVPAEWTPRSFLGRDFWPGFYAAGQSTRSSRPGSVEPDWDLDVFRVGAVTYGSCDRSVQPILPDKQNVRNYAYRNTNRLVRASYELKDYCFSHDWRFIEEWPKPQSPAFFGASAARPAYFLPKDFPADRAFFKAWLAAHPNFVAFHALDEFDHDSNMYNAHVTGCPDASVRDELLASFPVPTDDVGFLANMRECANRSRAFYFGHTNVWSLYSSTFTLAHMFGDVGMNGIWYEATGQEYARWQVAAAYLRGAARQFGLPYGWYVAHFLSQHDRKTDTCKCGHNYWTGDRTPSYRTPQCGPWYGLGRTLLARQNAYGWLIGSSFLEVEDWIRLYRDLDPTPGGRYRPHPVAKEFDYFYHDTRETDRGVHYTPCALLAPMLEKHNAAGMKGTKIGFSLNSFFLTLLPIGSDLMQREIKKQGNQGCLFNTPYGEFCDVFVPDSDQPTAVLAKALSAYKVAILAGDDYIKGRFNAAALERYVTDGGTLILSWDRIADGFVPAQLAGVDFAPEAEVVPAGDRLVRRVGGKTVPFGEIGAGFAWAKPKAEATATPVLFDEKGAAAAWARTVGKGRVVTFAAYRFLRDDVRTQAKTIGGAFVTQGFAGTRTFPLVAAILKEVQRETMPVTVEGDCQWGVNKVEVKGRGRGKEGRSDSVVNLNLQPRPSQWSVWAFNNKGVVKYFGEPETYDATKTAKVRIVFRGTGRSTTVELAPGEWQLIAFDAKGNRLGMSKAELTAKADAFVRAARQAYRLPAYSTYTNSLVDSAEFKLGIAHRPRQPGAATVRWIDIDGSANFRDIGGWNGLKTGRAYRGAEMNCQTNPAFFGKGQTKSHNLFATAKGLKTLSEELGIRTDLDLRAPKESPTPDATPIPGAKLVRLPISAYTNALRKTGWKNLAAALRVFSVEENYPIYFHCYGGADRTGTLAFLLEGLCGVDEADLSVDYELTTFGLGWRPRTDNPYYFASLVKAIKERPGATLKDKIESFVTKELGLTEAEVASIRRMLAER